MILSSLKEYADSLHCIALLSENPNVAKDYKHIGLVDIDQFRDVMIISCRKTINMTNKMNELSLKEKACKSLLANVLDMDDDLRLNIPDLLLIYVSKLNFLKMDDDLRLNIHDLLTLILI